MKDNARLDRQRDIEEATYTLLAEKGYAGTSMLSIAKRARCSNETLYNWYGDKVGLLKVMVANNARDARLLLEEALEENDPPLETLEKFGQVLLRMLLGDRPISLNQAAAADASGELGKALSEAGREKIFPLLASLFEASRQRRELAFENTLDAVDLYLGLLIGDRQIRRVIGRLPAPSEEDVTTRARLAVTRVRTLLAPP